MPGDDLEEAARRQYQVERRVQEMHAQERSRVVAEDAGARAQGALRWSVAFLIGGGIIGLLYGIAFLGSSIQRAGQGGGAGLVALGVFGLVLGVPVAAYAWWATYWGWLWTWRWWRQLTAGFGCFGSLTFVLIMAVLFFYIPLVIASWYGILGGGIYQYRKAKRVLAEGYQAASARVQGASAT